MTTCLSVLITIALLWETSRVTRHPPSNRPTPISIDAYCPPIPRQLAVRRQVTIIEQICRQCPPLFSHEEFLGLHHYSLEEKQWWEAITLWLRFLHLFTAMHILHLYEMAIVSHISHTPGGT
jgi:hypothetical protein